MWITAIVAYAVVATAPLAVTHNHPTGVHVEKYEKEDHNRFIFALCERIV